MPINRMPQDDQVAAARRVRAIVEAKENMAWPCRMEAISLLFGFHQLSPNRVEQIASLLRAEGVLTDPDPLPSRADCSALLFIEGSPFALGWRGAGGRA
jgi:hypothetical protein